MIKKSSCIMALCLFGFALSSQSVNAEPPKPANFPNRPINFVVSYPAGGGMDITARTLAAQMERVTGYQFRVQNRGGGGGIIGNTFVAKQAKPDGYTVGILANPTLIINILGQGAHFAKQDIEPIAGITFAPVIWVVQTKSKLGNMDFKQIIAYSKKHPGELKTGVIPNASFDMATRIVSKQTGAQFTIVPFQGGKPAVVALLGGNIDMSAIYYSEVDQYVKAGTLKVVAVADNAPVPQAPKAPTMKDLNIKMASSTWGADRFAAVPNGTDKAIKDYLAYLIQKTLADPKTAEAYKKVGILVEAKTAAQEQKAYDDAYGAVHDFLKAAGKLKASK
jgi:tripartite-type tricarboxylate transporter receptor subunit TctC